MMTLSVIDRSPSATCLAIWCLVITYANSVAAMRDGWMLLQSSQLAAPVPGNEHLNDYLEYEFVFERRIDTIEGSS